MIPAGLICVMFVSLEHCVIADDHYAAKNGQTPSGNYSSWLTAASNIQDAVNAAATNDTVWIGSGRYTVPPAATNYLGTNVVFINRPLVLRSSNGTPEAVVIDGGGTNRGIAWYIRVTSTNMFVLDGLTISNCLGLSLGGGIYYEQFPYTGVVRNCIICDNMVVYYNGMSRGGGIGEYNSSGGNFSFAASNCVIRNNRAMHGGVGSGLRGEGGGIMFRSGGSMLLSMMNCLIEGNLATDGGGINTVGMDQTFHNCVFRGNQAVVLDSGVASSGIGGGALKSNGKVTMRNCLLNNNFTDGSGGWGGGGGGIFEDWGATLYMYNCTITSNRPTGMAFRTGGPLVGCNSIVYSNYNNGDIAYHTTVSSAYTNICIRSTNALVGAAISGYITNNPLFVHYAGQNFRVSGDSPCVNAGVNQSWMDGAPDLDNHSRIDRFSGMVDIGSYEYHPRGTMFKVR